MPSSSQAFVLLRTYTAEAGSSPASRTPRPGRVPRATSSATRGASSARRVAASAAPSRTRAVMGGAGPRSGGRLLGDREALHEPGVHAPRVEVRVVEDAQ